ncbi:MAG: PilZ domain-containing protein, partial [Methylomonas sp.]
IASDIAGYIKITMILPESGSSFSVHGMLTHRQTAYVSGAHYANHIVRSIDDVKFLCEELDNSTVFIRTH